MLSFASLIALVTVKVIGGLHSQLCAGAAKPALNNLTQVLGVALLLNLLCHCRQLATRLQHRTSSCVRPTELALARGTRGSYIRM